MVNPYSKMQRAFYTRLVNQGNIGVDALVGNIYRHNTHKDFYEKYLFEGLDTIDKIALDFGTGPGRNILLFQDRFKQIDGVDFPEVIEMAKTRLKGINTILYKTFGENLQEPDCIPDNVYDIVFSTLVLRHICVYDIRYKYLQEFFRVLKSGGVITHEMGFDSEYKLGVSYYENMYHATQTNGYADTLVEKEEYIINDLEKIGYTNIQTKITDAPWPHGHKRWIWFRGTKP